MPHRYALRMAGREGRWRSQAPHRTYAAGLCNHFTAKDSYKFYSYQRFSHKR